MQPQATAAQLIANIYAQKKKKKKIQYQHAVAAPAYWQSKAKPAMQEGDKHQICSRSYSMIVDALGLDSLREGGQFSLQPEMCWKQPGSGWPESTSAGLWLHLAFTLSSKTIVLVWLLGHKLWQITAVGMNLICFLARCLFRGGVRTRGYHSTGPGDLGQNIGLRYVRAHGKREIDFMQGTVCQRWRESCWMVAPYPWRLRKSSSLKW